MISVLFVRMAEASERRVQSKIYLILTFIIITFPAFFRYQTGFDWMGYNQSIEHIIDLNSFGIAKKWYSVENTFIFLTLLLKKPTYVMGFYAFFTQLFMLMGIWNQRRRVSVSWLMFFYMTLEYLSTYNTFRQWLAVSIIFWGIKFAENRQGIRFILCCIIAAQFHTSAYIAILIYFFLTNAMTQKRYITFNGLCVSFFPLIITVLFQVLYSGISKIQYLQKYFLAYGDGTFQLRLDIGLFLGILQTIIVINELARKNIFENSSDKPYGLFFTFSLWRLSSDLCMYINMFGRSMCYFSIFGLISFAYAAECDNDVQYKKLEMNKTGFILVLFCIWRFIRIMQNNGYGQIPLRFMF